MSVKPPVERPEPISSRINSVSSQFSDGGPAISPSGRGSISSWSEEPTHSNMDISTGHMILEQQEQRVSWQQTWAPVDLSEEEIRETRNSIQNGSRIMSPPMWPGFHAALSYRCFWMVRQSHNAGSDRYSAGLPQSPMGHHGNTSSLPLPNVNFDATLA
ncbi:hypothetical protein GOODEAATRI_013637 [Goodea atripinnis]|uniref:Uncharacterized protein n=1 Tax=Goodea atripinnis TaxID=208336 RepID=A0ABV0NU93_9TELE